MQYNNTFSSYHGELMPNYQPQLPIDSHHQFECFLDSCNRTALVSIGSDSELRLIYQKSDSCAPWQLLQISDDKVEQFAITQSPDNKKIRIIYSTRLNGESKLFHTEISSFISGKVKWQEYPVLNPDEVINKITLHQSYFMYTTSSDVHEARYYTGDLNGLSTCHELPKFSSVILDFKIGFYNKKPGVYLLYDIDGSQTLNFQAFGDLNDGQFSGAVKPFTIHGNQQVTSIDLIRNDDQWDHLVSAGTSISLYESVHSRKELSLLAEGFYNQIQVYKFGGYSSIWTVEQRPDQSTCLSFLTDYFLTKKANHLFEIGLEFSLLSKMFDALPVLSAAE